MKTRPNAALRERRRIINWTQGEFAAMIGASKDAAASWETGRNKLSRPLARRMSYLPLKGRQVFAAARFEEYRKSS